MTLYEIPILNLPTKTPHISGLQSREWQIVQLFYSGLQLRYLITELTDF